MKVNEFNEDETLMVYELNEYLKLPLFVETYGKMSCIESRISTDGEVEVLDEQEEFKKKYSFKKELLNGMLEIKQNYFSEIYTYYILKTKKLHVKNSSYIVVCEIMLNGNKPAESWKIYLKNRKDKVALKKVKEIIKQMKKENQEIFKDSNEKKGEITNSMYTLERKK